MAELIGLSRDIRLEWLNKAIELTELDLTEQQIKEELNKYISCDIGSPTNIRKSREILMKIWVHSKREYLNLVCDAIEVSKLGKEYNLLANWCMILLAYPVFENICTYIGKINDMQSEFTLKWLKQKLFDDFGEKSTIHFSSDKIIKTMKNMGAVSNEKVGLYTIHKYHISNEKALKLIVNTILKQDLSAYYHIYDLSEIKEFFPFEYNITPELIHKFNFNTTNFGGEIVVVK